MGTVGPRVEVEWIGADLACIQRQVPVSGAMNERSVVHVSAVCLRSLTLRCCLRQVKHMELEQRVKLARLILALAEDDREAVVAAYTAMGVRTKNMGEG